MNHLIKITEKDGKQLVSARDLHAFLEVKKEFATWVKSQISWFLEGVDYEAVSLKVSAGVGYTEKTDYAITLDTAKEMAMMSKVKKGKEARQYFIECERTLKTGTVKLPTPTELAYMLIQSESEKQMAQEQVRLLTEVVKEQAPKAEYAEKVLMAANTWVTTNIAAELGMSAIALNKLLKDKGVHRMVNGVWTLNMKFQGHEYTKTRTHTYTDSVGQQKTSQLTVWTEKGREFIHRLVNENLSNNIQKAQ